jgi:hypothetical protein
VSQLANGRGVCWPPAEFQLVDRVVGHTADLCQSSQKITYRAAEKSETLISEFRTSPVLRIAVTVDMISTGTDVKPLEVGLVHIVADEVAYDGRRPNFLACWRPHSLCSEGLLDSAQ